MKQFISLPKVNAGDKVAVISPSSGLAGSFPWVLDLGIERIENIFNLKTLEYPSTRTPKSSLASRAKDISEAFEDKSIKAVFATLGGSDQIELIKLLEPRIFLDNPKPFFGYSDNTHLHNFLWNLGIPSYYGGGVLTQFAMQGSMDEMTEKSIKIALFESVTVQIQPSDEFNDIGLSWQDKSNLSRSRQYEENSGWYWNGDEDVEGILWGGCVESLIVQFTTGKYLPSDKDIEGTILILETAEDIPDHWVIEYLLTGIGERGWLDKFKAVLVGRPKAWEFNKPNTNTEKEKYKADQREAVIKTIRKYNNKLPIIQNMDFGHTDPQTIIPLGKKATISSREKSIIFDY